MARWSTRCPECNIKWIKDEEKELNHKWHSTWAVECTECREPVLLKPLIWHFERKYLNPEVRESGTEEKAGLKKKNP